MAEPGQEEQHDSDSESSEDLQRCREATWEVVPTPACVKKSLYCVPEQPSVRFKADEHEQDGNELQTTPEFRAHVAKKLGAMLDSYICVSDAGKHGASNSIHAVDSEEDGFRLFYSSVPGSSDVVQPPSPRKSLLPSSSSDQDSEEEWQRCQEAAISATDILKHSAIPLPQQSMCQVVSPECDTENQGKKKKKRKKKKAKLDEINNMDDVQNANGEQMPHRCISQDSNASEVISHKKKKRKKKKAKLEEINSMDDIQDSNGEQVPHGCISQNTNASEVVSHKKKKRKKKKAKLEEINSMDDKQDANGEQVPHGCISQDSNTSEVASRKKKKKKKKSKSDISVCEEGLAGSVSNAS